jgi:hypothetical protein
MLKNHPDRICTYFAIDFEGTLATQKRLPDAAGLVQTTLSLPSFSITTAGGYVFRASANRHFYSIELNRFYSQTLGLHPWSEKLDEKASLARGVMERLELRSAKRIGFKVTAFLPLGMNHDEIVELMFGSFLLPAGELRDVVESPNDVSVQLHGRYGRMKTILVVAPQTAEQASQQIAAISGMEMFNEPRLFSTNVKDFRDKAAAPCLCVDVDLFRTDVPDSEVSSFVRESFDGAERIVEKTVQRLKSLLPKR